MALSSPLCVLCKGLVAAQIAAVSIVHPTFNTTDDTLTLMASEISGSHVFTFTR